MKFVIFSIALASFLCIYCTKKDVPCIDTITKTINPNKNNQKLLENIAGKTLQYSDSLGNKLDFEVGEIYYNSIKYFYKGPCGIPDWEGVGDHYSINETGINLVSSLLNIRILYTLSFHLEKVFPDLIGLEILRICISENYQKCNLALAELTPIGQPQVINNTFKNIYLGNITFTLKKDLADSIGEKRNYQNVWKAAFKVNPLGNNYHIQASKEMILYSTSNVIIPDEIYFNNTHGLIAFRLKDGTLWMQYGSF